MNALAQHVSRRAGAAVALFGTGHVGSAFLRLLSTPAGAEVRLVGVANSTRQIADATGLVAESAVNALREEATARNDGDLLAALDASGAQRRVIVDATASGQVAARHAGWLAAGYDVVTANKDAAAGSTAAWNALQAGTRSAGVGYGDAATVGAGLPVLATLRRLHGCGDRVRAIEGVFSGSLSWLFAQYDGERPFSALLSEARAFGYSEPDPRLDLSGLDVARKLVILARAAGHAIEIGDVEVENLVPPSLREIDVPTFLARSVDLDAAIEARRAEAAAQRRVLRHLAVLDEHGRARVGLAAVQAEHPAASLRGTDNLFALTTDRYRSTPLVIQGPGAGAEVTAQALLGDLLALPIVLSAA